MTGDKCTNGHDRCFGGASSGPDCPYCVPVVGFPSLVPTIPLVHIAPGNLNRLAADCHAANQHWWHDPATGERLDRNVGEMFMLMVSEVAEAMEGERKNLMDDKLPHRRMAEVELADVIIRIMNYAGANEMDLDSHIVACSGNLSAVPTNKSAALLQIVRQLVLAGFSDDDRYRQLWFLCRAIAMTCRYAQAHGYDLDGAVQEKRAYNLTRADHKAEARLAAGGKAF